MLLKVNTSNTDYSGIYAIDFTKMVSAKTEGTTKLDIIFTSGYNDQNQVFTFTITANKADEVINCIFNKVATCMKSGAGVCTLYDEYSNYKCCPSISGVNVKIRKV